MQKYGLFLIYKIFGDYFLSLVYSIGYIPKTEQTYFRLGSTLKIKKHTQP